MSAKKSAKPSLLDRAKSGDVQIMQVAVPVAGWMAKHGIHDLRISVKDKGESIGITVEVDGRKTSEAA